MELFRMFSISIPQDKLSEETITRTIIRYDTIKQFFYSSRQENEITYWIILIKLDKNMISKDRLAKWFCIDNCFVNGLKGMYAFPTAITDVVETTKDEIKTNIRDWEKLVYFRQKQKMKNLISNDKAKFLEYDVLYNNLSIARLKKKDLNCYESNNRKFDSLRLRYLFFNSKKPNTKINFYVEGYSESWKNITTLKRSFEVTSLDSFNRYDGQPILIWKDIDFDSLLKYFKNKETLIKVLSNEYDKSFFSTIPTFNKVNVFYGKQSFEEFIKEIDRDLFVKIK